MYGIDRSDDNRMLVYTHESAGHQCMEDEYINKTKDNELDPPPEAMTDGVALCYLKIFQ